MPTLRQEDGDRALSIEGSPEEVKVHRNEFLFQQCRLMHLDMCLWGDQMKPWLSGKVPLRRQVRSRRCVYKGFWSTFPGAPNRCFTCIFPVSQSHKTQPTFTETPNTFLIFWRHIAQKRHQKAQ